MAAPCKWVVGNWKLHGSLSFNANLLQALRQADLGGFEHVGVAVCPPALYLQSTVEALQHSGIDVGVQDVSSQEQGAYTGDIAAAMVRELGAKFAIVGHSERRSLRGDDDEMVAQKTQRALAAGLTPIVCVGETLQERQAEQTQAVVLRQLDAVLAQVGAQAAELVIAYEPVWAIGTGQTASPEQAQAVHACLRARMQQHLQAHGQAAVRVPLLYGGSVKPDNALTLFAQADIDGGLIGGAALKAEDFAQIVRAAALAVSQA